MKLQDNINFIGKGHFQPLFKIFGWQCKEVRTYREMDVIRADFYPVGHVLGRAVDVLMALLAGDVLGKVEHAAPRALPIHLAVHGARAI